jgi:hypothetical protein
MAAAVSLIFTITEHPRVHAETVIGADGAAGYDCPDFYTGMCTGGNAGDGLCGKTRKTTGRENLDFARRTSSAQVIVTMRSMGGPHAARSPARPKPAEFSFKAVNGRSNCDRREKSSFSTQSTASRRSPSAIRL